MRNRILAALTLLFLTVPLLASDAKLYSSYEETRQALLRGSVADVQKSAAALAAVARAEKQPDVAGQAAVLAKAGDLPAARKSFALLSDGLIKVRAAGSGARPAVAWCSMEKKSWLQPRDAAIANPYVDAGMRSCGEFLK